MKHSGKGGKVVIIVGAGSTISDGLASPANIVPPGGDKGFFRLCAEDQDKDVKELLGLVRESLMDNYRLDPTHERNDYMERVLVKVYSDIHIPRHGKSNYNPEILYQDIVMLLNLKLASAVNHLAPSDQSGIGRIVARCIDDMSYGPKDVSIITFNYDLHIEKNLHRLNDLEGHAAHKGKIFNFPHLYEMKGNYKHLPDSWYNADDADAIKASDPQAGRISLLKLHGSLNWVFLDDLDNLSSEVMLKPDKDIVIAPMLTVDPYITNMSEDGQTDAASPVIVPPIAGKSAVIPRQISNVWGVAAERLRSATEVIFFGYSFPQTDFESLHLFENTIGISDACRRISVINPDVTVVERMGTIPREKPILLFPDAEQYLQSGPG